MSKLLYSKTQNGLTVQGGATKCPAPQITKDHEYTRFIPINGKRVNTDNENIADLVLISTNEKGHYSILYNTKTGNVISLKPVEQYNQLICELFHSDRVKGLVPQDLIFEVVSSNTQLSYDNIIVRDAYGMAFALRSEEFLQREHINSISRFWAVKFQRENAHNLELVHEITQNIIDAQNGV